MNYEDKLAHHERKFKMWAWLMFYSLILYVVLALAFVDFELAKFALFIFMLTASLAIQHMQTARAILRREIEKTTKELTRILNNHKR